MYFEYSYIDPNNTIYMLRKFDPKPDYLLHW